MGFDLGVWQRLMSRWTDEDQRRLEILTDDERNYPSHCSFIASLKAAQKVDVWSATVDPHLWYCAKAWLAEGWRELAIDENAPCYFVQLGQRHARGESRVIASQGEEPAGSFHQINNGAIRRWAAVHGEMPWR